LIYIATNKINGKRYVGKTEKTLSERWYRHQKNVEYGSQTYFHRAIRKHGAENFSFELLEDCSDELNNEKERYWIATLQPEYNMTKGGDGGWINDQTGNTWTVSKQGRANMKASRKRNKKKYEAAHKQLIPLISSGNNYQSTHRIHTPWGKFETYRDASNEAKRLRNEEGRNDVVTDTTSLRKYCESDIILNQSGRRTYPPWRGQSTRQLGFYKEEK